MKNNKSEPIPVMDYRQYRRARRLMHECCNYIDGNCIALDDGEECVCVQSISYSLLCRWFRAAVLPQDNAARQEWNRTADMALLSGISEAKILEVKQTEIHEKASQSIKSKGWLPGLFRSIVKADIRLYRFYREEIQEPCRHYPQMGG